MNDKTHPLFKEQNKLWRTNPKFVQKSIAHAAKKYPKGYGILQLIDASIEYYEYIKTTTILEDLVGKTTVQRKDQHGGNAPGDYRDSEGYWHRSDGQLYGFLGP